MCLISIRKEIIFNGLDMKYGLNDMDIKIIEDLEKKENIKVKEEEIKKRKYLDNLESLKNAEKEYNLTISTYTKNNKNDYKEYIKTYKDRFEFLKKEYDWESIDLQTLNDKIINRIYIK